MKRSVRCLLLINLALVTLAFPARAFASADESAPGHFVEVEKGKIYYEECGTGPDAVVLIHDGIAHSAVWDASGPHFVKNSTRYAMTVADMAARPPPLPGITKPTTSSRYSAI